LKIQKPTTQIQNKTPPTSPTPSHLQTSRSCTIMLSHLTFQLWTKLMG
jgi:hypothetical protein